MNSRRSLDARSMAPKLSAPCTVQNWEKHCLTPKHKDALQMKTCLLAGVGQLGEDPIPVWLKARRAERRAAPQLDLAR